ncbi:hypothetical protein [Paraburkholderia sp. MM5384-R2]|uniref:hypothetical protein n=1 Tax=Paraburkholderia sp. MM5384-R2 TaxID=2723097 RepID=UPI001613C75A|nr:hypothetical protein [Paraburkholderia sp. MM5384-R2]MBB5501569.1 hypothetical protein [Paraburkholderia sp. MM5384-R2]
MTPDWEIVTKLVFPVITAVVVAAIAKRLEYRPKVITYMAHAAGFSLPPVEGPQTPPNAQTGKSSDTAGATPGAPGVQVNVHSVVVRNTGKKTAFNVRIGHNIAVRHYVIEPRVQHETNSAASGGWEILIPALVPNEQVLISYLYFPPLTWNQINAYTKSDEGLARFLNVLPTPQPSRWLLVVFLFFFYAGIAAVTYVVIASTQWILAVSHFMS